MPQAGVSKFTLVMRIVLALWLALLGLLSVSPLSFKIRIHTVGAFHDVGHYLVFGITGIILWLVVERPLAKAISFAAGFCFAFSQEWAENHLFHAGFEWKDVGNDTAGLISGFALMILISALLAAAGDERSRERY